jgi:hypothetical protein
MYSLRRAATGAHRWLAGARATVDDDRLIDLGLWLCQRVHAPEAADVGGSESNPIELPDPLTLVEMDRATLLALAQGVTLTDRSRCRLAIDDQHTWARILGGLALSYARDGDLVAMSALVRMSAHTDLHGSWLTAALHHLLDQQQPDGSFGLLAPELALAEDAGCEPRLRLRLTVEVLWALAEVAAARHRSWSVRTGAHVRAAGANSR